MRALALRGPLLSEAEKTEYHAAVAAQRARDEAAREERAMHCKVCEKALPPTATAYWHEPGCSIAVVCEDCAEVVANAFWHKHSGEFLTWPAEGRPA